METALQLNVGRQLNQNQTLNKLQTSASTLCFPRFVRQNEVPEMSTKPGGMSIELSWANSTRSEHGGPDRGRHLYQNQKPIELYSSASILQEARPHSLAAEQPAAWIIVDRTNAQLLLELLLLVACCLCKMCGPCALHYSWWQFGPRKNPSYYFHLIGYVAFNT